MNIYSMHVLPKQNMTCGICISAELFYSLLQCLGANSPRVKFYIFVFHHILKKNFESNLALQILEPTMMHLKVKKYFINIKAIMYL